MSDPDVKMKIAALAKAATAKGQAAARPGRQSFAPVLFRSDPEVSIFAECGIIAEHAPALPFAACIHNGTDGQGDDRQ
jgi:hypothetical protein